MAVVALARFVGGPSMHQPARLPFRYKTFMIYACLRRRRAK